MEKLAFIDYWKLVKDFSVGDFVQRLLPSSGDLSPFVGRVTAVHRGTGYVDVQWPFGNERHSVDDVVVLNPKFVRYFPPALNFSWYPGLDTLKEASKSAWNTAVFHPEFYLACAQQWHKGASEVSAYDELWHRYGSQYPDEALRREVQLMYNVARNATDLRIQAHAVRIASYWVAQNRQYRVTQVEIEKRKPNCPKCGVMMRRAVYKMDKGSRIKLFACPKCLFLIKRESLMGPGGLSVGW